MTKKIETMKILDEKVISHVTPTGYSLIIREKQIEIITTTGRSRETLFDIDLQNPDAFSEESSDFIITLSYNNLRNLLDNMLQNSIIRKMVTDHLKFNP